jgi:transcriptional regulator with XRE-family HTH domain
MAIIGADAAGVEYVKPAPAEPPRANGENKPPRLHRIRTVRRLQGMSLRTAARQLNATITQIRLQEDESSDLRLSELYKWQTALDVPLDELLVEPSAPLSRPVTERAHLVRVMKTAAAILENAHTPQLRRLAERLVEQLVALMPELEGVGPWHSVGRRRSMDEYGRIMEQRISDDTLLMSHLDNGD